MSNTDLAVTGPGPSPKYRQWLRRERSGLQLAGIETEPHRAALVGHVALLGQEVDDGMAGEGIELRAVGVRLAQQIAAELDHRALHPETEPQVGG